jgi:hypothetical protein
MARVKQFHLPRRDTDTETHIQQRFYLLSNFSPSSSDSTGFQHCGDTSTHLPITVD